MSTSKHRSFRKVLSVETSMQKIGPLTVKVTSVLWCAVNEVTARTIKTDHIMMTSYVGSRKHSGIDSIWCRPVSLNRKNPMSSKCFVELGQNYFARAAKDSTSQASRRFILATPSLSKNVKGVVSWFDKIEGMIKTDLGLFSVYACNIVGAKTWYPETACMYLVEGETVEFDLSDMGEFLTPSKVRGSVYFDSAKWNSLDQSKLAFKCNDQGEALNGLFA
jgi:hypothetical protein